jgi:pseudouridine-5'-phosphate glycosidase
VGLGVGQLPAFYAASSGLQLEHRADSIAAAAAAVSAHLALPGAGGILLVQPPPAELALEAEEVEAWTALAVAAAAERGLRGGRVTPFVLAHMAEASGGRTLATNIGLIVNNARTAAALAVALAGRQDHRPGRRD